MNPMFVITAVRAAIRIGRTTADAFEQYAQEKPILIPDAKRLQGDVVVRTRQLIHEFPEFERLLTREPELRALWRDSAPTSPEARETLESVAERFEKRTFGAGSHLAAQSDAEIVGGVLVSQWARGKGPIRPWARIIVAMADVSLEYVGSNPELLGVGGNGEKLIGAIATAIAERIPDDETRDKLGPRDRFAERLAGLVLHAGLKTLSEQRSLVFGEPHLQKLLENTIPPIIDALPADSIEKQVEWREVVDALAGPVVSSAMETLAQNPVAFFGQSFAADRAAGVLTVGVLKAASDLDVKERFSREGLLELFRAAAGVASEHPELILGELLNADLTEANNRSDAEALALNVFKSVAAALKDQRPPYDRIGPAIAVAVIDGVKDSTAALFGADEWWERSVSALTKEILDGLGEAISDEKSLRETVFNETQLVELARVVIDQVAETPHLFVGRNGEVQRVVAAVARAMTADKHLLLSAKDWTEILRVAAQEAAINPGRLFGINEQALGGSLATDVITRLLTAAAEDLGRDGRTAGPLLAGANLREAVVLVLRAASGRTAQVLEARMDIEKLVKSLNQAAGQREYTIGGKEWLHLFRALLPRAIGGIEIPPLDDAEIASLLAS